MIQIQFQNKDDLQFLYQLLRTNGSGLIQIEKEQYRLSINIEKTQRESGLCVIHKTLKKLILDKKRTDWCRKIIEEKFFYTDSDEQMQIINILYSILDGKRKDIPVDFDHGQDEKQIDQALTEFVQENARFSFDAFITFRLRIYLEKLATYIETAIDEYKLEQDYQAFIYYLRNFLNGRKAQMKTIYVVHDEGFIFYDENKQEMKRSELNQRIDRKLLSHHPVYVDSETIAPLISIAPEKIYLYTNHLDHGIVRTLKNIFEEKLTTRPLPVYRKEFSMLKRGP